MYYYATSISIFFPFFLLFRHNKIEHKHNITLRHGPSEYNSGCWELNLNLSHPAQRFGYLTVIFRGSTEERSIHSKSYDIKYLKFHFI